MLKVPVPAFRQREQLAKLAQQQSMRAAPPQPVAAPAAEEAAPRLPSVAGDVSADQRLQTYLAALDHAGDDL